MQPAIPGTDIVYDPERYRRFSERMVMFSRRYWDATSDAYRKNLFDKTHRFIDAGRDGFTHPHFAAALAGWTVYDGFGGAFGDGRIALDGDSGLIEPTRIEVTDRAAMTRRVKEAARLYGASLVGVADVDEKWIYTHDRDDRPIDLGEGIDRCVVMAIEMDYDGLRRSPSLAAGIRTGVGYSRMAMAQACLGQFIRNLGYRAIACGNDTAMSAPLAVAAGLGEVGRNGILITREFGPRVRLCKVFTDLPLVPDRPIDIGVRRFCEVCKRCAEECPSRSIPRGEPTMEGPTESNADGVMKWRVNPETCYRYWIRNGASCSNCIRVCPWNKPNDLLHRAVSGLVKTAPALNPLIAAADKWLGFGRHRKGGETL